MLIRSADVVLRQFAPALTDIVFEIRNHPSVRAHLRDPRPLSRDGHYQWVRENLLDDRRLHLFVAYHREAPVGIALLRNFRDDGAEVGVMIVEPALRRLTAYKAAHLVCYYGFETLRLERLYSAVPRHNEHALEFNRRCGFEPAAAPSQTYHQLVLTRERYRAHPTHARFRRRFPITVQRNQ